METKNNKLNTAREYLLLTLGSVILCIGVYFFKFPNKFTTGGISSLAIILERLFPVASSSVYFTFISIFFLLLSVIFLGLKFSIKTAYCTLIYTVLMNVLEAVYPMTAPFTNQKILELFFAVGLPSIGSAIIFNTDSSAGGMDIIAMIIKKYKSWDIGKAIAACDLVIVLSSLFLFGVETGMFSIMGLAVKSLLLDSIIENMNLKKSFIVITKHPEEVCGYINKEMSRGATLWKGVGAYTGEERSVIITALSRAQARALRKFIRTVDPMAFILISNSSEIFGKGFTSI